MQFCRNCGTDLAAVRQRAAAAPAAAAPAAPASAAPAPAPSASAAGPVCARCGGQGDANARFCKYCGSPFGAAGPAAGAAARPRAQVVVILRDGTEGGVYPLEADQADIGSREGDIVLADDPYLSPRHARIERRGDTFTLQDLGSANGVYFRIREPVELRDGDMILIGQQVLRFDLLPEAERRLGPARRQGVMVFGTPEAPRLARVVQYTTEGVERDVYYLHRDETVFGREQADVVFGDDPFLSRRHAAITLDREHSKHTLRDMGSSNGTAIRCRAERPLQHGDQFRLGRHLFRFDLSGGGRA
jgi:pSer/pThr/pTyr-binding forkhead associated (FHA) protein